MSELENQLEECGVCHSLHPMEELGADDDQGNEDAGHLCQSCYDRYYNTCDECHRIICEEDAYYEDDDRVLCYDCHRRHRSRYSINDYSYKPDPIFYGSDTLYMGVEIELDEGGESDIQARKLLEMAKQLDYRSHQAKTCGLHVHVNRTAFGDNIAEQEEVIARILYFFEKHWEELLKFSRRTHRQMEQWANRYGYKENPAEILDHAKKGFRGFRYTAVNLTNANTIEFRLFRGTLRYNSFIAALLLIDRICAMAICLNDEELKRLSWSTFVGGCEQYPELVQYLKERRLYVNEPVQADQEV